MRSRALVVLLLAYSLLALSPALCRAQDADQAWAILENGTHQKTPGERATAVRVLGLILQDPKAVAMAKNALKDPRASVRVAGATALGQMHASDAIADLKAALNDKDLHVVMAAAHALRLLNNLACYEVYYELLTGDRKNSEGMIAQEMQILHDPKQIADMGFNEGIGYIPFASTGWEAVETIMKDRKDGATAKAALISALATDPDAHTNNALVTQTKNGNWIIRVAALEAIAKRENPTLVPDIEKSLGDSKNEVRYTAAAAIIRLNDVAKAHKASAANRSGVAPYPENP